MRRPATILAAAGALTALTAAPASAHAGLMPGAYAPGTTVASQLVIVHGCGPGGTIPDDASGESATTAVNVTVPDGLRIEPVASDAWAVTTDGPQLRFEAADPDGVEGVATIDVEVTVPDGAEDGDLWVPVVQECVDGEQMAWTHEGAESSTGPFSAVVATVDRYAGMTAAQRADAERTPTWVFVVGTLAVAASAGAAVVVRSRRA